MGNPKKTNLIYDKTTIRCQERQQARAIGL